MKRFFFVDIENVGKSFLNGIDKLTIEDTLIICNNTMVHKEFSPAILEGLTKTRATIRKFYIHNAYKNAMDFELVIELGFLIHENGSHAQYYIVSNDRGFDVVNDYLKNKGLSITVKRIPSFDVFFSDEEKVKEIEKAIQTLLPEYPKKIVRFVQKGIEQSASLSEFHSYLQRHNHQDIYGRVKKIYINNKDAFAYCR